MLKRLPAFFFVVAAAVNLYGRYMGNPELAAAVKPALMPLLALSVASASFNVRVDYHRLGLIIGALLFGCAGDIFLLSGAFPMFASGIGAFLIGHIFYVTLFGSKSWKGLSWSTWLFSLVAMGGLVFGLVKLLKVSGALLAPMAVYGFMLMLLIFSTLCGLVRFREKGTWSLLFLGALLFTFSDSLIAAGTFGVWDFPLREFVIMLTYILAQSFLAIGGFCLARK